MHSTTFLAVALLVGSASARQIRSAEGGFCYDDDAGCGPGTSAWPGECQTGERQSPIDIPRLQAPSANTQLRFGAYKGDGFRMVNNGHSISIDFVGINGTNAGTEIFPFPDPLQVGNSSFTRDYKFGSAHFHWGKDDTVGSEHTIAGRSSALEIHLVHYLASYETQNEAILSGDESALTVVGVLVDVNVFSSLIQVITGKGHPSLVPIVKHLPEHREAHHEGGYVTYNEPLDFTQLLTTEVPAQVFTYKGSLTTPSPHCYEQVNWFVLRRPAITGSQDLKAFRTSLLDGRGEPLTHNNRPVKPIFERQVYLSTAQQTK